MPILHNIEDNFNIESVKLNQGFENLLKRNVVILSLKLCSCAASQMVDLMQQYQIKQISCGVNWMEIAAFSATKT